MEDLSLHILDVAENSIIANAKNIEIIIDEDIKKDLLTIEINDDGSGMNKEMTEKITDPFVTTRTTRRVGLGIPLLKESTEDTNGKLEIISKKGLGTKVKATFQLSHIDRKPMGNITETIISLVASNPDINIKYQHIKGEKGFVFDTKELKKKLEYINNNQIVLLSSIKKLLNQNLNKLII